MPLLKTQSMDYKLRINKMDSTKKQHAVLVKFQPNGRHGSPAGLRPLASRSLEPVLRNLTNERGGGTFDEQLVEISEVAMLPRALSNMLF
jgi:hypothetical protein